MSNPFRRSPRQDDRSVDALLDGRALPDEPALSAFVAEVRALAETSAPAPSDALAAMLEHGVPADARVSGAPMGPTIRRTAAVSWGRVALAGAASLGLVLWAAAANTLPAPAQTAVADVVGWISPLHLPRPSTPSESPTPKAEPTQTPGPVETSSPTGSHSDGSTSGSRDGSSDGTRSGSGSSDGTRSGTESGDGSKDGSVSGTTDGSHDGSGSGSGETHATPSSSPSSGSGDGDHGGSTPTPTPTPTSSSDGGGSSGSGSSGGGSPDGG